MIPFLPATVKAITVPRNRAVAVVSMVTAADLLIPLVPVDVGVVVVRLMLVIRVAVVVRSMSPPLNPTPFLRRMMRARCSAMVVVYLGWSRAYLYTPWFKAYIVFCDLFVIYL